MSAATCACDTPVEFEHKPAERFCARCALPIADERPFERKGEGAPPVVWALPWACPDCRAWGYVGVCVEVARRSTDEFVTDAMTKKHRETGNVCLRTPDRFLMGRLRRRKGGKMIYLLAKGETAETPIDPEWPLFDRRSPTESVWTPR